MSLEYNGTPILRVLYDGVEVSTVQKDGEGIWSGDSVIVDLSGLDPAISGSTQASLNFNNDNTYGRVTDNNSIVLFSPDWLSAIGTPTEYEVMVTVITGTLTNGSPTGVWLSLGSFRFWEDTSGSTYVRVDIRDVASQVIQATSNTEIGIII